MPKIARIMLFTWCIFCGLVALSYADKQNNEFITQDVIPNLMRRDRSGAEVASDPTDYLTYFCTIDNKTDAGAWGHSWCGPSSELITQEEYQSGNSDSGFEDYIDGVVMYGAINVAGFFLLIFGTLFYLIGLIFLRLFQCCGCCQYKRTAHSCITTKKRVYCTTFCNALWCMILVVIVLLGYFNGSTQLTESVRMFPESVAGVADIVQSEIAPVSQLYKQMMSKAVVNTLKSLNKSFTHSIHFHTLNEDLVQVNDSLNNLPDFDVIQSSIENIALHIENVSAFLDLIVLDTDDLEDMKINVVEQLDVMSDDILALNQSIADISATIRAAVPIVDDISAKQTLLLGEEGTRSDVNSGLMGAVYKDLLTIKQDATGSARKFPTDNVYAPRTTWLDVVDGTYASVDTFLARSMDCATSSDCSQSISEMRVYIDDLLQCLTNIQNKPDYRNTSNNLEKCEVEVKSIDTVALLGSVDAIVEAQGSGPTIESLNQHLDNVLSAIHNISLDEVRKHVLWVIGEVDIIPSELDILLFEVKKIPSVLEPLREPLYDMLYVQPMRINETLFDIETLLSLDKNDTFLSKYFGSVNKTINKLLLQFVDVEIQINNASMAIIDLNVSSYVANVDAVTVAIEGEVNTFNASSISSLINSFGTDMKPNLTAFNNNVNQFSDAINGTYWSNDMYTIIDTLYAANKLSIELLIPFVGDGTNGDGDLQRLIQGICSTDSTKYCDADADCSTGTCEQIGQYRCRGTGPYPVDLCTTDNDCSVSNHCLGDYTRMTALDYSLLAFGSESTVGASQDVSVQGFDNIDKIRNGGDFATEPTIDDLGSALDSIAHVTVTSYLVQLDDVKQGIADVDMSSTTDSISDTSGNLELDFSDFLNATEDAKKMKEDFKQTLLDGFHVMAGTIEFFYNSNTGMQFYLNQLAYDKLDMTDKEFGAGAMIRQTGDTFNDMQGYWQKLLDGIKSLNDTVIDVADSLDDYARSMDIMSAQKGTEYETNNDHGSLHFMMSLYPSMSRDYMVPLEESNGGYITENKHGDSYSKNEKDGARYCLTTECFDNSADYYSNEPVYAGLPAQASLINVFSIVWVPLGFVFLLALITSCCPFVCCKAPNKKKNQYHPATFMLCCMVCLTPWYLILPGFLFPFVILLSDGCQNYGNIGQRTLEMYGDELCDELGGAGKLSACNFGLVRSINVTVDVYGVFNGLNGDCSGASDPIAAPLVSLARKLESVAEAEATEEVTKDSFKDFRQPIKNDVIEAAVVVGEVMAEFLNSNADDVINCNSVGTIKEYLQEPICTYALGPLAWYLGMLYLAGWAMCCWGIPSACLIQHHCEWLDFEEKVGKAQSEDAAMFNLDEEGNELDEPAFGKNVYDENGVKVHAVTDVNYRSVIPGNDSDEEEHHQVVSLPYVYGKSNVHYHAELTAEDADAARAAHQVNKGDYHYENDSEVQVELTRHTPAVHDASYRDQPHHLRNSGAHNEEPDESGMPINNGNIRHAGN